MKGGDINGYYNKFWAVLVSAVASMVIGSVWYGPIFGKVFTRAMGMDKKTPEEMAAMSASGGSASGGKKVWV